MRPGVGWRGLRYGAKKRYNLAMKPMPPRWGFEVTRRRRLRERNLHKEIAVNQESTAASIIKLARAPILLRELFERMNIPKIRVKPSPSLFSPLEDAWHLCDIEREGYLVRIRRILTEELPVLENLDGDRMAVERRYNELEFPAAIDGFAAARAESLSLLQGLAAQSWERRGQFENRVIDLKTLIDMMVEHDQGHLSSIQGIVITSVAA
jgi:hypothetical protein